MPKLTPPPVNASIVDDSKRITPLWKAWMNNLFSNLGTVASSSSVSVPDETFNKVFSITVEISSGSVGQGTVQTLVSSGEDYNILDIMAYTDGAWTTGTRSISIISDTTIYSSITSSYLKGTPAIRRWGDTGVPFPTTLANLTTSTNGEAIKASPSAGTNYTTGDSLFVRLVLEKVNA